MGGTYYPRGSRYEPPKRPRNLFEGRAASFFANRAGGTPAPAPIQGYEPPQPPRNLFEGRAARFFANRAARAGAPAPAPPAPPPPPPPPPPPDTSFFEDAGIVGGKAWDVVKRSPLTGPLPWLTGAVQRASQQPEEVLQRPDVIGAASRVGKAIHESPVGQALGTVGGAISGATRSAGAAAELMRAAAAGDDPRITLRRNPDGTMPGWDAPLERNVPIPGFPSPIPLSDILDVGQGVQNPTLPEIAYEGYEDIGEGIAGLGGGDAILAGIDAIDSVTGEDFLPEHVIPSVENLNAFKAFTQPAAELGIDLAINPGLRMLGKLGEVAHKGALTRAGAGAGIIQPDAALAQEIASVSSTGRVADVTRRLIDAGFASEMAVGIAEGVQGLQEEGLTTAEIAGHVGQIFASASILPGMAHGAVSRSPGAKGLREARERQEAEFRDESEAAGVEKPLLERAGLTEEALADPRITENKGLQRTLRNDEFLTEYEQRQRTVPGALEDIPTVAEARQTELTDIDIDRRTAAQLRKSGRLSVKELVDGQGLSPSQAARALRRLREQGLVERTSDNKWRRPDEARKESTRQGRLEELEVDRGDLEARAEFEKQLPWFEREPAQFGAWMESLSGAAREPVSDEAVLESRRVAGETRTERERIREEQTPDLDARANAEDARRRRQEIERGAAAEPDARPARAPDRELLEMKMEAALNRVNQAKESGDPERIAAAREQYTAAIDRLGAAERAQEGRAGETVAAEEKAEYGSEIGMSPEMRAIMGELEGYKEPELVDRADLDLKRPSKPLPVQADIPWKAEARDSSETVIYVDPYSVYEHAREDILRPGRARQAVGEGDKLTRATEFLSDAKARGIEVDVPELAMVDGKLVVSDGFHRMKAAQQLGHTKIPVLVSREDLPYVRERAEYAADAGHAVRPGRPEGAEEARPAGSRDAGVGSVPRGRVQGGEERAPGAGAREEAKGPLDDVAREEFGEDFTPAREQKAEYPAPRKGGRLPAAEDIPKDERGGRILPGEEGWAPKEREVVHAEAQRLVDEVAREEKAEPTGRRAVRDEEGSLLGFQGVGSKKTGTALEDIKASPARMQEALKKDRGNALELEIHDAVRTNSENVEPGVELLGERGAAYGEAAKPAAKIPAALARYQKVAQKIIKKFINPEKQRKNLTYTLRSQGHPDAPRVTSGSGPKMKPVENDAVISERDGKIFIVGKVSPDQWVERVEGWMSKADIKAGRGWYRQLVGEFEKAFGKREAPLRLLMWAQSQQQASPSGGQMNALRAVDIARGMKLIHPPGTKRKIDGKMVDVSGTRIKAGLAEAKMVAAWRGQAAKDGMGAKLSDFVDGAFGRLTRTWVGDDPRGGSPVPIDVHAGRDVGFIDKQMKDYLEAAGLDINKLNIDLPDGNPEGPSYETGIKFYRDLTEALNKSGFDGGGWTPIEAQAVGWTAVRRMLGIAEETPGDIFRKNTRNVSAEVAVFGPGSPLAERAAKEKWSPALIKKIHKAVGPKIFKEAAARTDVRLVATKSGRGGYKGGVNHDYQLRALGSPEQIQDFQRMVGFMAQQEAVVGSRMLASGKDTVYDLEVPSDFTTATWEKIWDRVSEQFPALERTGFAHIDRGDGTFAIRMFAGEGKETIGPDGKEIPGKGMKTAEFNKLFTTGNAADQKAGTAQPDGPVALAFRAALDEVAPGLKDHIFEWGKADVTFTGNNWKENPDGKGYLAPLRARGRRVDGLDELARTWYEEAITGKPAGKPGEQPGGKPGRVDVAAEGARGPPYEPPATLAEGKKRAADAVEQIGEQLELFTAGGNLVRARGSGARTLAQAVKRDLGKRGYVDYRGRSVKSAEDIAVIGQTVRDPRFETFRVWYVKNGKLVAHEAVTSRNPALVKPFRGRSRTYGSLSATKAARLWEIMQQDPVAFRRDRPAAMVKDVEAYGREPSGQDTGAARELYAIRARVKKLGADEVYISHNHPSGQPKASREDIALTRRFAAGVPQLKGHVVTDHQTYTHIDRMGKDTTEQGLRDLEFRESTAKADRPLGPIDELLYGEGTFTGEGTMGAKFLGRPILGPRSVSALGSQLHRSPDFFPVIYTNSRGVVAAIQELPIGMLRQPKELGNYIRGRTREFGAADVFAYVGKESKIGEYEQPLRRLVNEGHLRDAVLVGQLLSQQEKGAGTGQRKVQGQKIEDIRTVAAHEEKAAYGEEAKKPKAKPFYSAVGKVLQGAKVPKAATGEQWLPWLRKQPGVKADELQWTGLDEFLASKKGQKITAKEVQEYIKINQIKIEETTLDDNRTKFSTWQLEGPKQNYREVLLRLPGRQGWTTVSTGRGYAVLDANAHEIARGATREEASKNARAVDRRRLGPEESFIGGHFTEENILAHVRLNDRTAADGRRTLFVEEIQSDWHAQGRMKGYGDLDTTGWTATRNEPRLKIDPAGRGFGWVVRDLDNPRYHGRTHDTKAKAQAHARELAKETTQNWTVWDKAGERVNEVMDASNEADAIETIKRSRSRYTVPDAPMKDTWHEMALRRIVKMAADEGYDQIAWATGEQQAERYDLSKRLDNIIYTRRGDTYSIDAAEPGGRSVLHEEGVDISRVEALVGKELARKIELELGNVVGRDAGVDARKLSGLDLKVGGEGLKHLYDNLITGYAKKFGKKFGAQVGRVRLISDTGPKTGEWEVFNPMDGVPVATFKTEAEARAFAEPTRELDYAEGRDVGVHSLDITPQMRETAVSEGFPAFETRAPYAAAERAPYGEAKRKGQRPLGRDVEPGESPRVEKRTEALERAETKAGIKPKALKRDAPRTWDEHLDPEIRAINRSWSDQKFHDTAKERQLTDSEKQALDARVAGHADKVERSSSALRQAQAAGDKAGVERAAADHIKAGLTEVAAMRLQLDDGAGAGRALAALRRVMDASKGPSGRPEDYAPKVAAEMQKSFSKALGETMGKVVDQLVSKWKKDPRKMATSSRALAAKMRAAMKAHGKNVKDLAREEQAPYGADSGVTAALEEFGFDAKTAKTLFEQWKADPEGMTKTFESTASKFEKHAADLDKGTKSEETTTARKLLKELPGLSDRNVADLMRVLREDPQAFPELLRGHFASQKPFGKRYMDASLEWWKAGLLSAFSTDAANHGGNLFEVALTNMETAIAAGVDSAVDFIPKSLKGEGERSRYLGEASAELRGSMQAFAPALKTYALDMIDVYKLKDFKIDPKKSKFEFQVGAVKGLKGRIARTSFNKLVVGDKLWRSVGGAGEIGKLAYREVHGKNPKGSRSEHKEALENLLLDIRLRPEKHMELIKRAGKAETAKVFQEQPGVVGQGLQDIATKKPIVQVILPFIKTPANILTRAIRRSPLGFVDAAKAQRQWKAGEIDRAEFTDRMARPILGSMIAAGFFALAKGGFMTGGGPLNYDEKSTLQETGWQRYSFTFINPFTGKRVYLPFTRFEPISVTMGLVADMAEATELEDRSELFDKALGSIVENITNKSYLRGLADAASVFAQGRQFMPRYTANLAKSLIPNIVGRTAWAMDPILRDTKPAQSGLGGIPEKVMKSLQSRVPGLSRYLPARRGPTGRKIVTQSGPLWRFMSPIQPSGAREDRATEKLLGKIGYSPGTPGHEATVKGLKLRFTDAEYQALSDSHLLVTNMIRDQLIPSTSFQALPDTEAEGGDQSKEWIVKTLYNRARAEARKRILGEGDFGDRIREAIRKKKAGLR